MLVNTPDDIHFPKRDTLAIIMDAQFLFWLNDTNFVSYQLHFIIRNDDLSSDNQGSSLQNEGKLWHTLIILKLPNKLEKIEVIINIPQFSEIHDSINC